MAVTLWASGARSTEAEGRRQAVLLLGLGVLAGALLALVVRAGAEALLGRRVLGIAAFLRREEAGQVPAGRRNRQDLFGGAGVGVGLEGADEIGLQGADQVLAGEHGGVIWASHHPSSDRIEASVA